VIAGQRYSLTGEYGMKHDVRELSMIEKPQQMLHGNQSGPMKLHVGFGPVEQSRI
jgi:hypothetical protein